MGHAHADHPGARPGAERQRLHQPGVGRRTTPSTRRPATPSRSRSAPRWPTCGSFTANTGAPGGQVAEFQVFGTPAPNPDLIDHRHVVHPGLADRDRRDHAERDRPQRRDGRLRCDHRQFLPRYHHRRHRLRRRAGGRGADDGLGQHRHAQRRHLPLSAKVDETNSVIEQNEGNNTYTHPTSLVVGQVQSSDLVARRSAGRPSNPTAGQRSRSRWSIRNQGNIASASGAHGITLTVLNEAGRSSARSTGRSAAPSRPAPPQPRSTSARGRRPTAATRSGWCSPTTATSCRSSRPTTPATPPLFVGRGANMPYDMYEAEDGQLGGGATVLGPNRTIGDLAGEASGRRAVHARYHRLLRPVDDPGADQHPGDPVLHSGLRGRRRARRRR